MKITLSGTLGSGKSTVGKMLAEKLGYKYYYTGQIMRDMAEKRGMTLLEFVKFRELHPSINKELDDFQENLGKSTDNFVLDGHVGFVFVPDSKKIFLKCKPKIATERVLKSFKEKNSQRLKEGLKDDDKIIMNSLKARNKEEVKQYIQLYGVDFHDESNFDFVIDTSNIPPEEVCARILKFLNKQRK